MTAFDVFTIAVFIMMIPLVGYLINLAYNAAKERNAVRDEDFGEFTGTTTEVTTFQGDNTINITNEIEETQSPLEYVEDNLNDTMKFNMSGISIWHEPEPEPEPEIVPKTSRLEIIE